MTLPVLLTHVAARWATTRTPAHGWVPEESETEMTEHTYTLADMARAWVEGRDVGYDEGQHAWATGELDLCPNPYEQEEA